MRAFFMIIGLGLALSGAALADAAGDCVQNNDRALQIRACTLILEGRVTGSEFAAVRAAAYVNRGYAYDSKGDHDRAIADYGESIRLDPQNPKAYYNRGIAYDSKGEHNRAITDFGELIRLDPQNPEAYYNRGVAYYSEGDFDRAIADYDQAIRLDPKAVKAYYNRGYIYHYKGDYDRAIADYDEALRARSEIRL